MLRIRHSDHYEAFARLWLPPSPRGAVLYLHGIQSHGLWFEASAARLAEAGFAVLLPDRRGSGRNEVERGHASSDRLLLRDVADGLDELHVRTGLGRFHLLGVSWGGKLAAAFLGHAPARVASLTLVAPGLFPRVDIPLTQKIRIGLASVVARRTLVDIPLDQPELFTANPARQAFIRSDKLKLSRATVAFMLASRRLDTRVARLARLSPGCPLKVFLAGRDRIIDNDRTKAFIRSLPWPGRGVVVYPEAHHTIEFEPDPRPFVDDLVDWMSSQAEAESGQVLATSP
ncbi:MAG: alpha/beta fold hydrolase [Phycisphaerae bacterium]